MKPVDNPGAAPAAAAREVRRRIEASRRPLITSHIRLDGDALGSELGLAHILARRGARPHVVNDSVIPQVYRFMPGAAEAGTTPAALRDDYDLCIALDIAAWERAGGIRERLKPQLPVVSIDHHPPVGGLGDLDWVDAERSAVGEMILQMALEAGWTIPPEAATCLYVAIVTDTGRFTYGNTRSSALRAAAELLDLGADHARIHGEIYQNESRKLAALRGEAMRDMRFHAEGRIAVMTLTREMLSRFGVDPIDTQDFADIPRALSGVRVGVPLREMDAAGKVKVSLRSRGGFDVEPIARKFGGGGHHEAAGCESAGGVRGVEEAVVAELLARMQPPRQEPS